MFSDAVSGVGLQLGGPYDLISGKLKDIKNKTPEEFLCHHRFYYDPPEFQVSCLSAQNLNMLNATLDKVVQKDIFFFLS